MGFTPHKAKQPLLGMNLQGERISQSSYTWKEAISNFCTPTSPTNVHISEGQTMHRG